MDDDGIQCFDGDGMRPPPTAFTVFCRRCDVVRIYDGQGRAKLRVIEPDATDSLGRWSMSDLKARLHEIKQGAAWFQLGVGRGTNVRYQSFYNVTLDSIQEVYDGLQFRISYESAEPPLRVYTERGRPRKADWSISNP